MMEGVFGNKQICIPVKESEILTEMGIFMYRPWSGSYYILYERNPERGIQTEKISSGLDILHIKDALGHIVQFALIYQDLVAVVSHFTFRLERT